MKKFVLGLTGGIACGKSMVTSYFREYGTTVVDADVVSREVMSDPEIIKIIGQVFPGSVEEGTINRAELKKAAFVSPETTAKLNAITHPLIRELCRKKIDAADGFVLFVVPLLFETGLDCFCDATAVVACDREKRIKRLILRDNIDRAMAENIMARQMDDRIREKKADYVIRNDGDEKELKENAIRLMKRLGLIE